jgi:hypothetical protein
VELDRVLRDEESLGDRVVWESFREKLEHLELACAQPVLCGRTRSGQPAGREHGVACDDPLQAGHDALGRRVHEYHAVDLRLQGLPGKVGIEGRSEQHERSVRQHPPRSAHDPADVVSTGELGIDQRCVGRVRPQTAFELGRTGAGGHDLESGGREEAAQSVAHQPVGLGQHKPRLRRPCFRLPHRTS